MSSFLFHVLSNQVSESDFFYYFTIICFLSINYILSLCQFELPFYSCCIMPLRLLAIIVGIILITPDVFLRLGFPLVPFMRALLPLGLDSCTSVHVLIKKN
jgi:hypothetical protein